MKRILTFFCIISSVYAMSSCSKSAVKADNENKGYTTQFITFNATSGLTTKGLIGTETNGKMNITWSGSDLYQFDMWTDKGFCGTLQFSSASADGKSAVFTGSVNVPAGSSEVIFCYGVHQKSPWAPYNDYNFIRLDEFDEGNATNACQQSFPYVKLPYSGQTAFSAELTPYLSIVKLDLSEQFNLIQTNDLWLVNRNADQYGYFPSGVIIQDVSGVSDVRPNNNSRISVSKTDSDPSNIYVCLNPCASQETYDVYEAWDNEHQTLLGTFTTPATGLVGGTFYTYDGNGAAIPVANH